MTENTNSLPQPSSSSPQMPPALGSIARPQPYSQGKRALYGILWAAWTAVLAIGSFAALFGGQILVGLLGLALAALAGHYDYRIWTWRARRLLFLIIW